MEARYPLLRRHQFRTRRAHLVINFSRIMSRSRTQHRDLHTRSSHSDGRPNFMFVPTDNQRFPRRVVANIHESREDRKISGGGKYSNRRHRHHRRPEHPWPTPHSENTREAHPGAPFIAGLAEGRRRARREKRRGRVRTMSVAAGRAGNLIANTFHSPANFKPISSVYCQSQRARNSSLSVRNEILPMVPFRRSPWPFDLHWRRLDNLRIPRTRVAILKRERFVQRWREIYDGGNRPPFRYVSVSMWFKYLFRQRRYQGRSIESGQFADAFYVFGY